MKLKEWMKTKYMFASLQGYIMNFHYILVLGLVTLISFAGVITSGPFLIALCSTFRKIIRGEKAGLSFYFSEIKNKFIPGIFLSVILLISGANFYLLLYGTDIGNSQNIPLVVVSFLSVLILGLLFFYYPFACFSEKKIGVIIRNAIVYLVFNPLETVVTISFIYIMYSIFMLIPAVALLLFLPTAVYAGNYFIEGNNIKENELEETYKTLKGGNDNVQKY